MLIDKPSKYRMSALHTLNRFFPQRNLIERLLLAVKEHLSSPLSLLEPCATETVQWPQHAPAKTIEGILVLFLQQRA